MPNHCVVFGCNATSEKNKDRSFHRLPLDPKVRTQWLKMLNRKNYSPGKYAHVCSHHFADDDFKASATTSSPAINFQKKKLKKDAVPRFNLRGQQKDQKELHRTTSTSKNARQKQHVCISKDSFSSNDEIAMSFDEDVAAQISVHEGNDSDDLQSATNEIAKLRKENEALKKQIFKWENLSGDEIKN